MVFVVGLSTLVRRGWRAAAFHTGPPAVLFAVWWLAYGRGAYDYADNSVGPIVDFVQTGVRNVLGDRSGAGRGHRPRRVARRRARRRRGDGCRGPSSGASRRHRPRSSPAPSSFMVVSAVGVLRCSVPSSRRVPLRAFFAALIFLRSRSRPMLSAPLAHRRRGRPRHPARRCSGQHRRDRSQRHRRPHAGPAAVRARARRSPYAHRVPRSVRPLGLESTDVTLGWSLDGVASGRIPAPSPPLTAAEQGPITLRLVLRQYDARPSTRTCRRARRSRWTATSIRASRSALPVRFASSSSRTAPPSNPSRTSRVTAGASRRARPVDLRISPAPGGCQLRLISAAAKRRARVTQCRNAHRHRVVGYVADHDGVGTDLCTAADSDRSDHLRTRTDRGALTDPWSLHVAGPQADRDEREQDRLGADLTRPSTTTWPCGMYTPGCITTGIADADRPVTIASRCSSGGRRARAGLGGGPWRDSSTAPGRRRSPRRAGRPAARRRRGSGTRNAHRGTPP